jgi:hypothetical protein
MTLPSASAWLVSVITSALYGAPFTTLPTAMRGPKSVPNDERISREKSSDQRFHASAVSSAAARWMLNGVVRNHHDDLFGRRWRGHACQRGQRDQGGRQGREEEGVFHRWNPFVDVFS